MKKRILCFGDSNTYGFDAATGGRFDEDVRWTGVLSVLMGEDYTIIEEGLSGRTTVCNDTFSESARGIDHVFPIFKSQSPLDKAIIMLGTNDTKERFGLTPQLMADGMARVIEKAMSMPIWRDEKPNILIVSPAPIEKEYENMDCVGFMGAGCSEKSYAAAAYYKETAKRLGCDFFDAAGVATVHHLDFMHLNENGHKKLAFALAGLLKDEFEG